MKCKREVDARSLDHQVLEAMRKRAVEAVREGNTVASVAAVLGLNPRTVFRWMAAYARSGPEGLMARPITGRPAKRTAAPGQA